MRQKIFIFLLTAVFLISQINIVDAKGVSAGRSGGFSSHSSGSSRSIGGSSSYSKGYSGSSKSSAGSSSSKSSSGSSSSKSPSSSSGSSSRSVPGSYSGSSSSSKNQSSGSGSSASSKAGSSSSASSSKVNTAKSSYMQDYYKKEVSTKNYSAYKQTLNSDQKKVYDESMNSTYKVNNRMNMEDALGSRPQRISYFESSRPVRIRINTFYFGGPLSYGSAYVGPWDLWFLMRASDLFWYHHWAQIYPYRDYFEAQQFADMQARISQLEQQNIARDPSYMDPGVDPDLQFSNDYQQNHLDSIYYTNKYPNNAGNPLVTLIIIVVIVILLIIIIRKISRPRRIKPSDSRIY